MSLSWRIKRFNFILALVLCLTIGHQGAFAQPPSKCDIALSGTPSAEQQALSEELFKDPVRLFEILEKKRKKAKSDYMFEMGSEFIAIPQRMLREIETLEKTKLNSEQKIALKETKDKIQNLILARIPYGEYLATAELFARAITYVKFESPKDKWDPLFSFGDPYVSNIAQYALSQGAFFIPSFENLNLNGFIRTRAAPVYVLGLTIEKTYVDGSLMTPLSFWFHDINHSREMSGSDFRLFNASKKRNLIVLEQNRIMHLMLESIDNHSDKSILEAFTFSWLHENSGLNFSQFLNSEFALAMGNSQAKTFVERELNIDLKNEFLRAEEIFVKWRTQFIQSLAKKAADRGDLL